MGVYSGEENLLTRAAILVGVRFLQISGSYLAVNQFSFSNP